MKVAREICISGSVIDITVRVPSGNHKNKRAARTNITKEKVQKNNDRMTRKHLGRIINANFDTSCWHDTLTYKTEPTREEAQRIFKNYIARLSRAMKKIGMELKWVMATEYADHRLHHHFITNAPLNLVKEKWNDGLVMAKPMYDGPNYQALADYIIKETSRTLREDELVKSRYSHSRNLIIPVPKVEMVEDKQLFEEPKAWKGYYIDEDTVRRYEHPITGLEHLEYFMVSLDEEPRLKKYYKGKKKSRVDYNRYINYAEEQQNLFDYEEVSL